MWDFLGGPVVKILNIHYRGVGSVWCWGTKIPQAIGVLPKEKDNCVCLCVWEDEEEKQVWQSPNN